LAKLSVREYWESEDRWSHANSSVSSSPSAALRAALAARIGLGLATTAGRIGSIFGPIICGALLEDAMSVATVCLAIAVPAVLSATTFSRARRLEPVP